MRHDNGMWVGLVQPTYVLVRDDLDILHVSSGLENLSQDFLGDPWVQTADVKGSLVGLWGGAPDGTAGAHWGAKTVKAVGVGHVHGERVVVLRDVEAERRLARHSLAVAILVARLARHATHGGRHGELGLGGTVVVGHYDDGVMRGKEVRLTEEKIRRRRERERMDWG
jgi:hypothetical protein